MATDVFLSRIGADGRLVAADPASLALDAEATLWLDLIATSSESLAADHAKLAELIRAAGCPEWLDTDRLLQAPGTGDRRPAKIKVVGQAFLARFYWVEPENLDLDRFMHEVVTDATGRGDRRPRRQEIRAFCGEGLLITVRIIPQADDGSDSSDPHADLVAVLGEAPLAAHGRVATAAAMLARFFDAALEDELDAIEGYDEMADDLQDRVLDSPDVTDARQRVPVATGQGPPVYTEVQIQKGLAVMRREVGVLRRLLIPYGELRELTQNPIPSVAPLLAEFVDLREGVLRVVEWIDTVRDLLTSTYEALLARQSNQMNLIMKKLTAWAAILLVPTLIAGIYGMNFRNMPELRLVHGYYGALLLIFGSMGTLYVVFRRKRWL